MSSLLLRRLNSIGKQVFRNFKLTSQRNQNNIIEDWDDPVKETVGPPWNYNWDRKGKDEPEFSNTDCFVREIVLLNCGQSTSADVRDYQTSLSDTGKQQAEVTADHFHSIQTPFSAVYYSPYKHARETAVIINDKLVGKPDYYVFEECHFLQNCCPVTPEPNTIPADFPDDYYYKKGPMAETAFRKHFYRPLADADRTFRELIVTHDHIISYLILRALQFPAEYFSRFLVHHCSLTVLYIDPEGFVTVNSIGDTSHLPLNLITE